MLPVITLKNILVEKGENFRLVVDYLSLNPGLVYSLTGPNGAGKSTLLRVMANLQSVQRGDLVFASNDSDNLISQRQKVTLVAQSPYLFKGSVADNLDYGLKLRKIDATERKKRISTTLSNVGLAGFEDRAANKLSGGETQRVALARALVLKPEILLLDEPTANIDSNSLDTYETLLSGLPQYGVTVVFTTHDPSQARRLGDEVLRIENGLLLNPPHRGQQENIKTDGVSECH
jgi:tungstate transport system ATP-binding protein